jgi:CRISPR-associated exonuclease Cas4
VPMPLLAILVALALIALAIILLLRASSLRGTTGLPSGRVVFSDTGEERRDVRPLFSERYGLAGKPDYLVRTGEGLVPVEVKPERTDAEPRESHLLQVLAYCLLLEEMQGKKPPYGLLHYKHDTFRVDYNRETRARLLSVLEEMRESLKREEVHRNHEQPARCRRCAYREVCDESLWAET